MNLRCRPLLLAILLTVAASPAECTSAADAAPALRTLLAAGRTGGGAALLSLETLRLFYAERGHSPAWNSAGRPSPQVDDLLRALRSADREGLRPADYHLAAIDNLRGRLRGPARTAEEMAGDLIDLDLLLSDAFFLYAGHLTSGRVSPESVEPEWNIPARGRALTLLLAAALDRGHLAESIARLPPAREDYRRLRDALAAQRAVAAGGGWPLVPWDRTLRAGDRGPPVAALRRRLAATGELPPGGDAGEELFDAALTDALRRFQARHGLEADAVAGRRTIAALNTPALQRTRQIEANLERLRWLPRDLGSRHLLVNIPDFRRTLTEGGAPVLTMRVVAGRQSRRTPFFTGEITSILVNPPWIVPAKIAFEDKLPLILDDRDVFTTEGFTVLARAGKGWREIDPAEVDWARLPANRFPYRLRQEPGPRNALGRLKFQVPNRHDIYLHDTPSRGLFTRPERAFS
jgi:murein L,D-transpeptidase YcbB/YkuD